MKHTADIGFYHLTRTTAVQALPKLLGRTLALGRRALVLCADGGALAAISAGLWASTDPEWLPHASPDSHGCRPDWQPIWLTTSADGAAVNGAQFLFVIGRVHLPGFERVFDLFDGNNPGRVVEARARWVAAKAEGHRLTYWQQGENGWSKV